MQNKDKKAVSSNNPKTAGDKNKKAAILIAGILVALLGIVIAVAAVCCNSEKGEEEREISASELFGEDTVIWADGEDSDSAENVEVSEENASSGDSESSEENASSEGNTSSEENASSEESTSEDDNTSDTSDKKDIILADWESIPAGSLIPASDIDWNRLDAYFTAYEISDEVFGVINGKSFRENPDVGLEDLRYLKVLHYNFNHEIQVGELIVATDLQSDFIGVFTELFQAEYEIQSLYLVDNYWTGDPTSTDSASIDENNSSAFLYRPATGSSKLSKHAYGRAIDINPQQNPYVSYSTGSPVWSHENANDYIDRTTGLPHMITEEDTCYKIFIKYGFTWGGSWTNPKDYQHFQK